MAKWAVVDFVDLLLVGSMLARAAHPELIVHQWTTGHNACRELGVTVWASLTPRKVQRKIIDEIKFEGKPPLLNQVANFLQILSEVKKKEYIGKTCSGYGEI